MDSQAEEKLLNKVTANLCVGLVSLVYVMLSPCRFSLWKPQAVETVFGGLHNESRDPQPLTPTA